MKTIRPILILGAVLAFPPSSQAGAPASVPVHKATFVQNSTKAINYSSLKSSTKIDFKGTALAPDVKGSATVKSKDGGTYIDAKFENLPAATQFGPEYLTYVLWAVSPEGRPTNLGELIVKKGKSKLEARETLQSFGLIVTAEPYFAISSPSNAVVVENAARKDTKGAVETIDAKYELVERASHDTNLAPSEIGLTMDEKTPLAVYEARNAVRIAKAAGADAYAEGAFRRAQDLLAQAEKKEDKDKQRTAAARESVQRAEEARLIAVKRQDAENAAGERQMTQQQIDSAKVEAANAALAQARAETAQAQAELAKGQAVAGRDAAQVAAATAEQAKSQAQTERNTAVAGRDAAQAVAVTAEQAKSQAQAERNTAMGQVKRAEDEKAQLRAQLLRQFNAILDTRDSARGLIVNMSGVLFATGKAELQPAAREKLAKISGVVLAHPDLKLEIEGHTDNVGGLASNQALSERRAKSALDYLVSQGLPAASIVSRGFGSSKPVASNDTASGRQSNRRVELVVTGDSIRISMNIQAPQ